MTSSGAADCSLFNQALKMMPCTPACEVKVCRIIMINLIMINIIIITTIIILIISIWESALEDYSACRVKISHISECTKLFQSTTCKTCRRLLERVLEWWHRKNSTQVFNLLLLIMNGVVTKLQQNYFDFQAT